jgi:glyoxylase-like metal-dependent hydrolase (beta-lactamase superfamily II)
VADHDCWASHFGATRIIHETEVEPSIDGIEVQLSGSGPWNLSGEVVASDALDGGVQLVHTPGHTAGSICMWHAPSKTMFTGDHFGFSERLGRVVVFTGYNRAGVAQQARNVQKLLDYDFLHVLPGHGRCFHLRDAAERLRVVTEAVDAVL